MRIRLRTAVIAVAVICLAALVVGVVLALTRPHGIRPGPHSASPAAPATAPAPARSTPAKTGAPTAAPSPTKSLGTVSTPSAIVPQLSRFLAVYYTKTKGESISTWTAAIKAVTSAAAWPEVQPTIGLPPGWVSKGVPLTRNVVTQDQNTTGEVYVIMQVSVTLTDPSGATQTYTYNTGSEWTDRGNQWTMLTFAGAPAGGG